MTYESNWWSVQIPQGWQGQAGEDCSTLWNESTSTVLQLSAARKNSGEVTDNELKEFAHQRLPSGVVLEPHFAGSFSGFTARYRKDGVVWREWWLRSGQVLVYATHNTTQLNGLDDVGEIETILSSLQSRL